MLVAQVTFHAKPGRETEFENNIFRVGPLLSQVGMEIFSPLLKSSDSPHDYVASWEWEGEPEGERVIEMLRSNVAIGMLLDENEEFERDPPTVRFFSSIG